MLEKLIVENLLAIAVAYAKATGQTLTQVGKRFYGRGDFFPKLKAGQHTIGIDRAGVMLEDFRREFPQDARWPATSPILMTRSNGRK